MGWVFVLALLGYLAFVMMGGLTGFRSRGATARSKVRSRQATGITISIGGSEGHKKIDPKTSAQRGDKLWVAPGVECRVGRHSIAGGMVYVGKGLASISGWDSAEPALIDSSLSVARRDIDYSGQHMGYWPSYSRIDPRSRAAYVEWLSSGRADPGANIGYVFLFLYGLERRLLFDLVHLPDTRSEAPHLIAEVKRLLSIYTQNGSFQSYARGLLSTSQLLWDDDPAWARAPSFDQGHGELPSELRVALGQIVVAGEPISPERALAWVMGHPETRLRTPARRCPEEFQKLFLARYREKFGGGMTLKPNKRRLKVSYHPASASFGGAVDVPVGDLPDVGALSRPIRLLREVAETAMSELEAFSRFVGKNPDRSDSLEALALLPAELASGRETEESKQLQVWMNAQLLESELAIVRGADVMAQWTCKSQEKMSKGEIGSFSRMLESRGYGIEPDPRFGGGAIQPSQKVVVFRAGTNTVTAASAQYRAAALLLHLAAAVAASDGSISEAEERQLEQHLERSMHLSDAEIRRLRAHLQWLLSEQPSLAGITRRLQGIDAGQRRLLAEFAVAIAGADGVIDPGEVKMIMKIYALLGFDPDQAFGDIHSLQTSSEWSPAEHPVTVRPADKVGSGYAIPKPPNSSVPISAKKFELDMDKVEKTLAETAVVSNLLSDIFVEEDPPPVAPEVELVGLAGLDPLHSRLLQAFDGRDEMSREEFEGLTDGLGLLSDGAYETLNEAAFEHSNAALLEGEDPISVDSEVLGEMLR